MVTKTTDADNDIIIVLPVKIFAFCFITHKDPFPTCVVIIGPFCRGGRMLTGRERTHH